MAKQIKGVDKLIKARSKLILSAPAYGVPALSLKLVPLENDPWCWAMGTDGVHLFFNPDWVADTSVDEITAVVVHEVWHIWSKHDLREQGRQHIPWNYACDASINPIIKGAGYRLPANCVGDEHAGLNAETIYERLPKHDVVIATAGGKGKQGWNIGGVKQNPGVGTGKKGKQEAEAERDVQIHQWAEAAKRAGKVPAELARLIDELLKPRLPWREILARFVDTNSRNDYSWQHCDPEYARFNVYMPIMHSEELGLIGYIGDTSGSINAEQHKLAVSELQGMLRAYDNASVYCMWVDHALHNPELVTADDVPLNIHPQGGGGTSFRPGFEHMEEAGIKPKCVIYSTDGYCDDYPDEPPPYPVLWLVVEKNDDFNPPWGEVVRCDFE